MWGQRQSETGRCCTAGRAAGDVSWAKESRWLLEAEKGRSGPVDPFWTSDLHGCKRTDLCFRTRSVWSFVTTVIGNWYVPRCCFVKQTRLQWAFSLHLFDIRGCFSNLDFKIKDVFYEIVFFFKSENELFGKWKFCFLNLKKISFKTAEMPEVKHTTPLINPSLPLEYKVLGNCHPFLSWHFFFWIGPRHS